MIHSVATQYHHIVSSGIAYRTVEFDNRFCGRMLCVLPLAIIAYKPPTLVETLKMSAPIIGKVVNLYELETPFPETPDVCRDSLQHIRVKYVLRQGGK